MSTNAQPAPEPTPVRMVVLGDSIACGQGADRIAERPARRLVRALAERGYAVERRVVAVSGSRSSALAGQVDQTLPWRPDLAVIIIGANDLTHRVSPWEAARDLGSAVRRLRETGCDVVVAPAPDLSVVPGVPPALRPVVQAGSALLRSRQVAAVRAAGGHVADPGNATSAAFAADRALFSADSFHPSGAGYAVIAENLLPTVLEVLARRSG